MGKVVTFFAEVRSELGKVAWPTPRQTVELTVVVIVVSLIIGAYIGLIDLGLANLSTTLLQK